MNYFSFLRYHRQSPRSHTRVPVLLTLALSHFLRCLSFASMADPFTIVGATSAVMSFVQFAERVIVTAYMLYKSTTDNTLKNTRLEYVTSEMNRLVEYFDK